MLVRGIISATLTALSIFYAQDGVAGSYKYEALVLQGDGIPVALGLNNKEQVVGYTRHYSSDPCRSSGFVWTAGTATFVGKSGGLICDTDLRAINDAGVAVGAADTLTADGLNSYGGLIFRSNSGETHFTHINRNGSSALGLELSGIDNEGNIVGNDHRGVIRRLNGVWQRVQPQHGAIFTYTSLPNTSGAAVGYNSFATRVEFFSVTADGQTHYLKPPQDQGSSEIVNLLLGDDGRIVGTLGQTIGAYSHTRGFILQDGKYEVFDYPGAFHTDIVAYNKSGIYGEYYLTSSSKPRLFVRRAKSYVSINAPFDSPLITAVNDHGSFIGTKDGLVNSASFLAICIPDQEPCN